MKQLCLAYKAWDVHELLCHAIADAAGLYAREQLSVTLLDATFLPDEALPENSFQSACGAALASFLGGRQRKVVFVACDRPMFWLYARAGFKSLAGLAQARVATFPDVAPPARFLANLLHDARVAPGLLPCRDDASRLGLLCSGSVDAALLSSQFLPCEVRSRGLSAVAFIGDTQRVPSSGLAVSGEMYREQPQLVSTMVRIYGAAMRLVYSDEQGVLRGVLKDVFGKTSDCLDEAVRTIRACYNRDGTSGARLLQDAVDKFAGATGRDSFRAAELYDFTRLDAAN